ncbi:MAG: type VII secretion protein EssC [Lachnospiraceae bacterium]|nr:type VII secretion protein EssC [Lachnospiraceae bacterium]
MELNSHTNSLPYPLFNRNTRIRRKFSDEKISILDAPEIPKKPHNNIVLSLLPSIAMLAVVIFVRGGMNSGSGSSGSYIIMTVMSMGIGIITTVISFISNGRQYKKDCEERIEKYTNYIEKKKTEVSEARQEELDGLREMCCDINQDLEIAMHFDRRLFEKTKDDEDFLKIYLGRGTILSQRQIDYKKQERLEVGDELTDMPEKICEMFSHIDHAPICMELKESNAVGIVGSEESLYGMFKNIVTDIAVRHYYGDVRMLLLIEDEKKYDWVRLLPHISNDSGMRNVVFNNESKNNIFESLFRELTWREQTKKVPYHCVVLIENEFGIKNHPISRYIENASELGMTFVFFEKTEEELPLHCNEIVRLLSNREGEICKTDDGSTVNKFEYEVVSDKQIEALAYKLAPVYCEEISLENSLRKNITLYELLHIYSADDLNLNKRWNDSQIYKTMAAPLGVNAKEEVVCLNLHEKFHGPHGLVAGTTGSGKSEILQSYILSAATLYHPYEIGFVIIDFKGGGMVNQFRDLPHLIGAITNIDGNEVQRSLKSIKAELLKRQSLFAEAGVNHIDKYIRLYKEKKVTTALPHLVIIVDEFAELKAEQPEFMKELISAARIGRSLGVHLILATQKPSGVVDAQIWSNSKFKLCLKVQSKEDSNEVLKTPLAAEIKEPGRAYLQVGNNEIFELFQSAYSGASAAMNENAGGKEFKISQLNFGGAKKVVYQKKKVVNEGAQSKNQLEAIVEYIAAHCDKEGINKLPNICMPPLPERLVYQAEKKVNSDEIYAHIGLLDDPDRQSQKNISINLTAQNYMLIGSAQSGKTNVLQTIIRSLVENYTPEEVNMYIIDFGSMILRNFSDLKHCGGVVCVSDDERLKNLVKLLNTEIVRRKERFAEVGVSSFSAYKEAGKTDIPQIVVFIDNLTALKEMYLQENDFLLPLCRDGIAVGITFVAANSQTSGIGYRYLNNFEGRMTMFCSETSEYGMMFEGCRMKLPSIPGRSLVQINKATYECQMYLSFEGEKEFERVQAIREFVEEQNARYPGAKAQLIPEIPKELNVDYVKKAYPTAVTPGNVVLGLDYATVLPVAFNVSAGGLLALSGKKEKGKDLFAKYFVESMCAEEFGNTELYIIDDMTRAWGSYEFHPNTSIYTNTNDSIPTMIDEIEQRLQARYENASSGANALAEEPWLVLLIESSDAIDAISADKKSIAAIRNIIGKYRMMKVMLLFTNIENANIAFGAPELMKIVKENKRYLIFDDANNIKLCDVSVSVARKYAKPIELCDAYYINDSELSKLKTVKLI